MGSSPVVMTSSAMADILRLVCWLAKRMRLSAASRLMEWRPISTPMAMAISRFVRSAFSSCSALDWLSAMEVPMAAKVDTTAASPELSEVEDKVRDFLRHARRGEALSAFVEELREKATIEIA